MNIGRNDPCPCGSGKKYKKCCFDRRGGKTGADDMQALIAEVRNKLESGQFTSIDEAQATLVGFMHRKNTAPCDDFHGLSPEQMHRFLHFPLESQPLIQIKDVGEQALAAPVLTLFSLKEKEKAIRTAQDGLGKGSGRLDELRQFLTDRAEETGDRQGYIQL